MILDNFQSKFRAMKTKIDIRKVLSEGKNRKAKGQAGIDSGIKGLGITIAPSKS